MQIDMIAVEALVPYARNSRTHGEQQIAQIAASISEFGFTNPVLIDGTGGIIAGHGRVLGARKLGIAEVPCIRLEHLSEAQKRAYVIADNKLAMNSGWSDEMLALELRDLEGMDFNLGIIGLDSEELASLLWSGKVEKLDSMPAMPSGDKSPFQQITFTVSDAQAEQVRHALKLAGHMGPYVDTRNENGNGNALARVCETFLTDHGKC